MPKCAHCGRYLYATHCQAFVRHQNECLCHRKNLDRMRERHNSDKHRMECENAKLRGELEGRSSKATSDIKMIISNNHLNINIQIDHTNLFNFIIDEARKTNMQTIQSSDQVDHLVYTMERQFLKNNVNLNNPIEYYHALITISDALGCMREKYIDTHSNNEVMVCLRETEEDYRGQAAALITRERFSHETIMSSTRPGILSDITYGPTITDVD